MPSRLCLSWQDLAEKCRRMVHEFYDVPTFMVYEFVVELVVDDGAQAGASSQIRSRHEPRILEDYDVVIQSIVRWKI